MVPLAGLLDFASLFLLAVLLGSFQVFEHYRTTTLDEASSRNVNSRTLQSPVPPFWFSTYYNLDSFATEDARFCVI